MKNPVAVPLRSLTPGDNFVIAGSFAGRMTVRSVTVTESLTSVVAVNRFGSVCGYSLPSLTDVYLLPKSTKSVDN